ncbi:uncharacterized protein CC84DRAFT_436098 [Paraphaeosphaeria sporulosa]|uniref:Uncharacterized protein n=1 Tax=Paraphaeosphaeria sporulosa TaxID=1460663 RepID=A0A177CPD9_9PLEO|nr:uncharacterized protein CC84DRAFT_436098 [Paraphaeosphaeria sporulosa]OAG09393.1 hypothetical protein CC84DRAFT_436098 [Paraphaeosphaeria sporulosa]
MAVVKQRASCLEPPRICATTCFAIFTGCHSRSISFLKAHLRIAMTDTTARIASYRIKQLPLMIFNIVW